VSRGTGTPVSFGFSPTEAKQIITKFLETEKVVCLEFTEVNPLLDNKGNKMAETAFDILNTCFK
jgi:arginase